MNKKTKKYNLPLLRGEGARSLAEGGWGYSMKFIISAGLL